MRLIDADALLMNMNLAIAILEGTMKNLGLQDDAECQMELKAYRDIRDGIKDEPTAEPTVQPERKQGRWIKEENRGQLYRCSACGNFLDFRCVNAGRGNANYCPNCGADMREENES